MILRPPLQTGGLLVAIRGTSQPPCINYSLAGNIPDTLPNREYVPRFMKGEFSDFGTWDEHVAVGKRRDRISLDSLLRFEDMLARPDGS